MEGDYYANGRRFPEASRRLEVVRAKKNGRESETRESSSRAPVLSCFHYFQAPATQAKRQIFESVDKILSVMIEMRLLRWKFRMKTISFRT